MDIGEEVVGKGGDAFACGGADGEDAGIGVAHKDILAAFVHIEIEIGEDVCFVNYHDVADLEHEGVFQRFVVAFGDRENHCVTAGASVELGRTDEIAYVFKNGKVYLLREILKPLAGHACVKVTHAASMQLDGLYACLGFYLDSINVRVDVSLHNGNAEMIFEVIDELDERGGLATAWGGHQVQEEETFGLQIFAEGGGGAVVRGEDALFDFDDFYGGHNLWVVIGGKVSDLFWDSQIIWSVFQIMP